MKPSETMSVDHFYWKHPFYADLDSEPSNSLIVSWQHQNDRSFLASVSPNMEALSLSIKLL